MKHSLFLFFAVLLVGLTIDLGTKKWAFSYLGMPGEYDNQSVNNSRDSDSWWAENVQLRSTKWVVNGLVGVQTTLNEGALFGMGQGKVPVFATFSFVALIGIFCWLTFFDAWKSSFLTFVLALICAGILGNLYDRLGLPGLKWNYTDTHHELGTPVYAVRDWILIMIGKNPWPNFNIADAFLVCGAVLLTIFSFFTKKSESKPENQPTIP